MRRQRTPPPAPPLKFKGPAPTQPPVNPGAYNPSARTLLELAKEVDEAEDELKRATLAAIRAGDVERAEAILDEWLTGVPPVELAARVTKGRKPGCT